MRAIVVTGYGDVDKLEVGDVPEPRVGPGEVKVRVTASSVNPIDWKLRGGGTPPRDTHWDAADRRCGAGETAASLSAHNRQ
jgi:NADPH:quinone reductase-like Zn-dependent oxidoreductase